MLTSEWGRGTVGPTIGSLFSRIERVAATSVEAGRFWLWAAVALAVAHALVVFACPVPPLHDYPGHLARIHIMASLGRSDFIDSYYEYQWLFRHNMGTDVLIFALAHVMPIEIAGRLVVAAIPALTILGLAGIRLKAFGRVDSLVLLAVPFAMGTWFGWGFINFCLSAALMLVAFAIWLHVREWKPLRRVPILIGLAFAVWLAHLTGWAAFCVMVGSWELVTALQKRGEGVQGVVMALARTSLACLPLLAPIIAMALAPSVEGGATLKYWDGFLSYKLDAPFWSLAFTWDRADKYVVVLMAFLAVVAVVARAIRVSLGLALAGVLMFVAFLIAPSEAFGGGSVDVRMLTPFALIAGSAIAWRTDLKGWRLLVVAAVTLGAGGLVLGRLAYTTAAFQRYNAEIGETVALIDQMPEGARVLTLVAEPLVSARPPLNFLTNMAVVRKDAFSNVQWEAAGGHTLTLKYLRDGAPIVGGEYSVIDFDAEGRSTGEMQRTLEAEPLERFDYVWIVNTPRTAEPELRELREVGRTERTTLYEIVR